MGGYTLKKIASLLEIDLEDEREITSISEHSSKCKEGSIFVALKGQKVNGEDFLKEAKEKGAIAAVVSKTYEKEDYGLRLLKVKDPVSSLKLAAKKLTSEINPFIIAITGSVGKTTTKDFIAKLLSSTFEVYKTKSSYNSQIGLPLTILNSTRDAKIWVLEMGISEESNMKNLIEIAPAHVSVITKIAPAHFGNFGSVEKIAKEKKEILSSKQLEKSFVHPDNKKFFSEDEIKKFHVNFYEIFPEKLFELPFNQDHLIENFLVARQVASYVGVSEDQILKEAKGLTLSEHRFENKKIKKLESSIFIDDSYNSNPFALKISLIQFGKLKKCGRKIAVIGEMKELGSLSKMAHQEAAIFVKFNIDELLCFGKEAYPLYETATSLGVKSHYFEEKPFLVSTLYSLLKDGDSVLFKGSNSNKLWEVFEMIKTKFE